MLSGNYVVFLFLDEISWNCWNLGHTDDDGMYLPTYVQMFFIDSDFEINKFIKSKLGSVSVASLDIHQEKTKLENFSPLGKRLPRRMQTFLFVSVNSLCQFLLQEVINCLLSYASFSIVHHTDHLFCVKKQTCKYSGQYFITSSIAMIQYTVAIKELSAR